MLSKRKSKKAVSLIVSYVLLISITFAISGMVYVWLKGYVEPRKDVSCDDNVGLVISKYDYFCSDFSKINLTLKNNGLFTIDGFIVRVDNRTDLENIDFGRYIVIDQSANTGNPFPMKPGQTNNTLINMTKSKIPVNSEITFLELQPYIFDNEGQRILCKSLSTRDINCSM